MPRKVQQYLFCCAIGMVMLHGYKCMVALRVIAGPNMTMSMEIPILLRQHLLYIDSPHPTPTTPPHPHHTHTPIPTPLPMPTQTPPNTNPTPTTQLLTTTTHPHQTPHTHNHQHPHLPASSTTLWYLFWLTLFSTFFADNLVSWHKIQFANWRMTPLKGIKLVDNWRK